MRWPMSRRADAEAATEVDKSDDDVPSTSKRRRIRWSHVIAYGALPGMALLLASGRGLPEVPGRLDPRR